MASYDAQTRKKVAAVASPTLRSPASGDRADEALRPGQFFAERYEIEKMIRAGGMGAVYQARHAQTGQPCAIKVMLPRSVGDPDLRARFQREATVAAQIQSDHVVTVFDAGVDRSSGAPYIVMELLDGRDVSELIEPGALKAERAVALVRQLCQALERTHAKWIIHRDLKPENLFVTRRDDGADRLVLLDFGIAKVVAQSVAKPKVSIGLGTPLYMAPEQLHGRDAISPRTDLYAVGHVAYALLVGEAYWAEEAREGLFAVLAGVQMGLPEVASRRAARRGIALSRSFDEWFSKATSLEPDQRFESASLMEQQLTAAVRDPTQTARVHPGLTSTERPPPVTSEMGAKLRELIDRSATLPSPIAALVRAVEGQRDARDARGTRARAYQVGLGIIRFTVALGLAALDADRLEHEVPSGLADRLRAAVHLSHAAWLELAREIAVVLVRRRPKLAKAMATAVGPAADRLIASWTAFAEGGEGQDAPAAALAMLQDAEKLMRATIEVTPAEAGVSTAALTGPEALVEHALLLDPWVPVDASGAPLLLDSPHAPGRPWRVVDPSNGAHLEHHALHHALARLVGGEPSPPPPPIARPELVGRSAALASLERMARDAVSDRLCVAGLTGPLGIGRSRLVEELAVRAPRLGFSRVVSLHASSESRGPLRAFAPLLEPDTSTPALRAAAHRVITGDDGARQLGGELALESVEHALEQWAHAKPTLLIVEDVHWADEATLTLLRLLAERATRGASTKLMVVGTARDEPRPSPGLSRWIGAVQGATTGCLRLALGPLSDEDATALVTRVATTSSELRERLVNGAGGVPFFLVQPLLVWFEGGQLRWRDGMWCADTELLGAAVPGVIDLLRARLTSFFDAGSAAEAVAEKVLAAVAFNGAGLAFEHVQRAVASLGEPADAAASVVESLDEAGVIQLSDGNVAFTQPTVRRAVLEHYRRKTWLRPLHRALLDRLAEHGRIADDALFLADGYASLGERVLERTWLEHAEQAARKRGDYTSAWASAERLLGLEPDPETALRVNVASLDTLLKLGRSRDAQQRVDALDLDGAPEPLRVRARIMAAHVGRASGTPPGPLEEELVEHADALGEPGLEAEARLAIAARRRGAIGLRWTREALERLKTSTDDSVGDARYRAAMLELELLWETQHGEGEACRAAAERAIREARSLGSEWATLDTESSLAALDLDAGRADDARRRLERVRSRAEELHLVDLVRQASVNLAGVALREGDAATARTEAKRATELAYSSGSPVLGAALSIEADALLKLGQPEEAHRAIDAAIQQKEMAGESNLAVALLRRADILVSLGPNPAAGDDARRALQLAEEHENFDQATRARLWLATQAVREGEEGAEAALGALVHALEPRRDSLRSVTRRRLEEAEELLLVVTRRSPR